MEPPDEGAVRPVIASNGVPFLQMRSVGSHSKSGREKEGNNEGMESVNPPATNAREQLKKTMWNHVPRARNCVRRRKKSRDQDFEDGTWLRPCST